VAILTFAMNVWRHLGMPSARFVSKVNTSFEQLFYIDFYSHTIYSFLETAPVGALLCRQLQYSRPVLLVRVTPYFAVALHCIQLDSVFSSPAVII
jgi:hypothetical protein